MTGSYLGRTTPSPALTTEKGDQLLATLLRGRRFASVACKPAPRLWMRPPVQSIGGAGSSLTQLDGSAGKRRGIGASSASNGADRTRWAR